MIGFFKGSATAMITPFCEDGINFSALGRMIDYQIEGGTQALVIAGTTGEPATMSEQERDDLIAYAVKRAAGRVKIIVGAGSNCTKTAVSACKRAESLGADGILAVTPYYNKCTQNGLYLYYQQLCDATMLPVICYNVPSRTGVNILPDTMARIAEIPNIAGIKEASGNMSQVMETLRLIRKKCDLYSGEDILNFPMLAVGAAGVISVVSNLEPRAVSELCENVFHGKLAEAATLADRLVPLAKACFCEVNPIPVKTGMNLIGFDAGLPRAPLTPLEEAHEALLRDALVRFGHEVTA